MTDKQIEKREHEIRNAIQLRIGGNWLDTLKNQTAEEEKELQELATRSMVNSCACYGGLKVSEYDREHYFTIGDKVLGKEKVNEIIADQIEFFRNHAKVLHDVYIDCYGCSYNSIQWDC